MNSFLPVDPLLHLSVEEFAFMWTCEKREHIGQLVITTSEEFVSIFDHTHALMAVWLS